MLRPRYTAERVFLLHGSTMSARRNRQLPVINIGNIGKIHNRRVTGIAGGASAELGA
jgi:hypothetical protein